MTRAASRERDARARSDGEELIDAEVPAAVVCAHCGQADCLGCSEELTRSGIVALVAWERPRTPALARLWATARAATFDAERFFESMPDGPIAPALTFAIASEAIAVGAMALALLGPLALIFPRWALHLIVHDTAAVLHVAIAGESAIVALLVFAHVAYGWALDRGARWSKARGATRRAVRFGLYAAGWDLVIGPLGFLIVALKEGSHAALSIASIAVGLPGRSARALLQGCYHLEGKAMAPAMRASYLAAGLSTLLGAVGVIVAILVALVR